MQAHTLALATEKTIWLHSVSNYDLRVARDLNLFVTMTHHNVKQLSKLNLITAQWTEGSSSHKIEYHSLFQPYWS